MATALQNRLVGTVILVALAVIFLPDVLDGKKSGNADLFVEVPTQPNMRPVTGPEPFPAAEVQQAAAREIEIVDEKPVDDMNGNEQEAENANASESKPVTAETPAAENENSLAAQTVVETVVPESVPNTGWVVQLGSFRHQKNVRDLLDKLEKAGYRAFSRPVQTSAGNLTKVFVGPDVDQSKLDKALPHLKEVTGLQGKLTPFTVD